MSESVMPSCQALPPQLAAVCAVLIALVLTVIGLGFGPLRAWLGMTNGRSSSREPSPACGEGLLSIWRLYQQLGRTEPGRPYFSAPDIPDLVVRGAVVVGSAGGDERAGNRG